MKPDNSFPNPRLETLWVSKMSGVPLEDYWLFIANDGHAYYPELPFLVVNVNSEVDARFSNRITALQYVKEVMENYGRIIDTTPSNLQ